MQTGSNYAGPKCYIINSIYLDWAQFFSWQTGAGCAASWPLRIKI